MVFYPEITRVNISSLLIQSANHSYNIYIQENNTDIEWIKYDDVLTCTPTHHLLGVGGTCWKCLHLPPTPPELKNVTKKCY